MVHTNTHALFGSLPSDTHTLSSGEAVFHDFDKLHTHTHKYKTHTQYNASYRPSLTSDSRQHTLFTGHDTGLPLKVVMDWMQDDGKQDRQFQRPNNMS